MGASQKSPHTTGFIVNLRKFNFIFVLRIKKTVANSPSCFVGLNLHIEFRMLT